MLPPILGLVFLLLTAAAYASSSPPTQPAQTDLAGAQALLQAGQPQAALNAYDAALGRDPTLADAHAGKAAALLELGKLPEAQRAIDAALRLQADRPAYHFIAARLHIAQGRFPEARSAADRAAQLAPAKAGLFYADLAAALAAAKSPAAEPLIEPALQAAAAAEPPSPWALFELGQSLIAAGKPQGADYLRRYLAQQQQLPENQRDPRRIRLARQMIRAMEILQQP